MLNRVGFASVPPDLRRRLELNFCVSGTQAIEHSFKDERVSETRDSDNKTMGSTRKWSVPIQAEILTKKHHYRELNWNEQELDNSLLPKNMTSLFTPTTNTKQMTMDLPDLVSTKGPQWVTFAPMRIAVQSAELEVMRHYCANGQWSRCRHLWFSQLTRVGLALRRVGTEVLISAPSLLTYPMLREGK